MSNQEEDEMSEQKAQMTNNQDSTSERSCRSPTGRTSAWSPTTPRTPTPPSRRSSPSGRPRRPNVLVVLIDDAGFGASSAFGGPCETPNFEKLANGGLRYNRFHTTALCAPTRAALLTGRNHHSVGMGAVTELATSAPGNSSLRPNTKAPSPRRFSSTATRLRSSASATRCRCSSSPVGPFDMWPTGSGFEYFYGFIGGEDNQWYPSLTRARRLSRPKTPEEGYHLTEDLADRAVAWVRMQKTLAPDKPFFMYFAPARRTPAPRAQGGSRSTRASFAHGWDEQRERTFARQKELGVIPQDADLTERHEEIPAWDDMDDDLKPILEREMEIYAGFMSHTDHHVGRCSTIEELGIMDDTLIYLIIGDNGASAEGTINGSFNEMISLNGMAALETPEFLAANLESSAARSPTTTTRWAGRTPWTRRSSGRSRSPRTGVARAPAPSCTG